jgi:hypothetical protein
MRSAFCLVLLLSAVLPVPGATAPERGLDDAIAARSMLGGETWARLVRIDSSRSSALWKRGPYPRILYALVFELSGILWFYTDVDGTQSLSLTRGTVARDEADPGPLFRSIDPGFTSWSWVDAPQGPRKPSSLKPRNACFVESVAALNRRITAGGETAAPSLLFYYVDTPEGRLGHTVLLFGTSGGRFAVDEDNSDKPVLLPPDLGREPLAVSAYLRGGPVASARTLPIPARKPPREWAALPSDPPRAG